MLLLSESDWKQSLPNIIFKLAFCLPSLFFSHCHVFAFQTPDARMAVIYCFKTVMQSHSLMFTTWLEILYSIAHAPSSKKRDFGHFISGRQAGSKGSKYQKTVGKVSGPLLLLLKTLQGHCCYSERWTWPGEDGRNEKWNNLGREGRLVMEVTLCSTADIDFTMWHSPVGSVKHRTQTCCKDQPESSRLPAASLCLAPRGRLCLAPGGTGASRSGLAGLAAALPSGAPMLPPAVEEF